MIRQGHAYLDLTALPETGAVLLDPRPAFLWAEDGSRILWANAAGVHFLGAPNVHALLQRQFGDGNPVGLQVAAAASATAAGEPQMTVIRFATAGGTEPVLCLGTRVPLDEDGDALLLSSMQPPARVEPLLGRAFGLAAAVAEDEVAAVVLRPDGRVIGASDGFREVSDGPAALGALAASTAASGRRMLKRRIVFGGARRLVGMAAVTTPEGPFVLALVGPAEAAVGAAAAASAPPATATVEASREPQRPAVPVPDSTPVPVLPEEAAIAEAPAPEAVAPAPAVPALTLPPETRPAETAAADLVASVETAPILLPVEATFDAGDTAPGGEAPSAADAAVATPAEAAPVPPAPAPNPPAPAAFAFFPRPAPVRFVFQIDPDRRFTQVSPEFATVVGPKPAAIVGRTWLEIAKDFGLGAADLVDRALSRRDTWSGITVYWPIQDSTDAVAVDLAALPAFNRSGTFEGFRGFGVCRTSDIRRELPDEPELPLADAAPPATPAADGPAAATTVPPAQAAAGPVVADDSEGSNIVRLPSAGKGRALTGNEQDAFRRIADALRSIAPRRGADAAPLAPQAEGAPANDTSVPAPVAAPEPSFTAAPATAAPAPDAVPLRFLDRLPVGFAVFRDRTILFANRVLLDRLGFADTAALAAAGASTGCSPPTPASRSGGAFSSAPATAATSPPRSASMSCRGPTGRRRCSPCAPRPNARRSGGSPTTSRRR